MSPREHVVPFWSLKISSVLFWELADPVSETSAKLLRWAIFCLMLVCELFWEGILLMTLERRWKYCWYQIKAKVVVASVTGCVADSCEAERLHGLCWYHSATDTCLLCKQSQGLGQGQTDMHINTSALWQPPSGALQDLCKNCPSFNASNKHILWLLEFLVLLLHWHLFRYRSKYIYRYRSCMYTIHHLEVTQSLSQNWRLVSQHSWGTRWLRSPIAGRPGSGHQIWQLSAIPCWDNLLSPLNKTGYKINIIHILYAP